MIFKESPEKAPFEGDLNVNAVFTDSEGREFLKRYPKENPRILRSIADEYKGLGFIDSGGRFRIRTPEEETRFTTQAAEYGLKVLPPSFVDEKGISYYRFLSGARALNDFLPNAPDGEVDNIVFQLITDLRLAHSKDFIYGDRWSPNMLIVPSRGLTHIDFDLEIYGRNAREFEVSQVAYYTLCAGRGRALPMLSKMLAVNDKWFDLSVVEHFLNRAARYFQKDEKYGNAEQDVDSLIASVRTYRQYGTG